MSLARRLALILLVASAAGASAASPTALDVAIRTMRPLQPQLIGDTVILSYWSPSAVRFVGARFEHERWAVLHAFSVNEHGVFVLDCPVPAGQDRVRMTVNVPLGQAQL